jgi:hypothetical protein
MRLQFQPSFFIRTSEPLIRVAVMLRLLIFSLSLTLLGMPSVHGFDGSDTEIPRIEEMSLVNKTALKANERIAILLKTSDDKNWVKLGGTLNIGYSYKLIPGRNTPPNCSTVTTAFSKLEAIEILSLRTTAANARKSQVFWLVGHLPAKKELVSNCAEYRDLTQAPVVVVNSTSFKSTTPRGSSTPIITGGIFLPQLTDESGRSAPTAITQRMQESQFLPGVYNFAPTTSCLPYADSVNFRTKNQSALDQFESEAKAARDLGNTEGNEVADQVFSLLRQVNLWVEFAANPNIDTLKAVPSCAVANSTSALLKAVNEARTKIKASNSLVLKANLLKRCEVYQGRYLELERKVLAAREQFKTSKMRDGFARFSYSNLRVDCASSSTTDTLLTSRESDMQLSEQAFNTLEQEALNQVVCEPFNLRLKSLIKDYTKANLKFSGSRYEKSFPSQNFAETYTACGLSPLDTDAIQIMTADLEAFITQFSIELDEAERLFKAKKITFKVTCSKGASKKLITNKTGQCPKGFVRNYPPSAT